MAKITDFGLAKFLEADTGWSKPGGLLGTPSYMSPEQARGQNDQIGPATDVYALGAILYELLTGRPPFRGDSHWNTLEQVRAQDPVPPARLQPHVPRDLDTICLKCLEKEPHRRYASARALAEDLGRFLAGEPIQARPIGPVERALKWARRRPAVAALLLVSAVAGTALLAGGLFYSQRLRAERDYAVKNLQRARLAVEQMLTEVAEEQLAFEPRMEEKRRRLLERALAFYQEFLDENPTDARMQRETALAHKRVADLLRLLGRHEDAQAAYGQAIGLLQPLAHEQPTEAAYRRDLADCHNDLGELLRVTGRHEQAAQSLHQARALHEQLRTERSHEPAHQQELARSYYNLGILYQQNHCLEDAEACLTQAIALLRDLTQRFATTPQYRHHLARGYLNLGPVLRQSRRWHEAETTYREALTLLHQLKDEARDNPHFAHELAVSANNLGNLLTSRRRYVEARTAHEQARDLLQNLTRDFPRVPIYRQDLANTLNSLGTTLALEAGHWRTLEGILRLEMRLGSSLARLAVHLQQARWSAAQQAYDQAGLAWRQIVQEPQRLPSDWADLGRTHGNLGWVLTEQGNWVAAQDQFALAIAALEEALKSNPRFPDYLETLRKQYRNLAETRLRLRDPVAAVQAAGALTRVPGADEQEIYFAACFVARGADLVQPPAAAEAFRDQALHLLKQAVDKGFQDVARLRADANLQALRSRSAFTHLLADLDGTAGAAAPSVAR